MNKITASFISDCTGNNGGWMSDTTKEIDGCVNREFTRYLLKAGYGKSCVNLFLDIELSNIDRDVLLTASRNFILDKNLDNVANRKLFTVTTSYIKG